MTSETHGRVLSGVIMVPIVGILTVGGLALTIWSGIQLDGGSGTLPLLWLSIAAQVVGWVTAVGFFTLQPNEARVLVLFGNYRGTVRARASTGATPSTPTWRWIRAARRAWRTSSRPAPPSAAG